MAKVNTPLGPPLKGGKVKTSVKKGTSAKDNKVALIKKGCDLAVKIKKLEEELKEIKSSVMGFFAGGMSKEEIVTPEGVAVLTVSRSYSLPEYNLPKVKSEVGDEFELYFEPKVSYGLTKTCHALLKDESDERKDKLLPFIDVKENKYVSFKGLS